MKSHSIETVSAAMPRAVEYAINYWNRVFKTSGQLEVTEHVVYQLAVIRGHQEVEGFIIDDQNVEVFNNLCLYFAGKLGLYDLNKGIALIGGIGCGKTILLRCFSGTPLNPFTEVSARKITNDYATGGQPLIEKYYSITHNNGKQMGLMIDDIGTETIQKFYGNDLNVIEQVLLNRYDSPSLKNKTHFTTNLSIDQIEQMYGPRVRSRIRERFNWISFSPDAKDRRI